MMNNIPNLRLEVLINYVLTKKVPNFRTLEMTQPVLFITYICFVTES